jgi:uncharacterized protein
VADNCPWQVLPEGLRIAVRLTPRGGRDGLGGVEVLSDGRPVLTARVRAAPSEGEANRALVRLLANALCVPVSRVSVAQGATSRVKIVMIQGDGVTLARSVVALSG